MTGTKGKQAMSDIEDLERRIRAAFDRIGQAVDGLGSVAAPGDGEQMSLQQALQAERDAHAQLAERLRAVKDREAAQSAETADTISRLTRDLDTQGLELQRMRKTVVQLRETLRSLREVQAGAVADPQLVNKAMLAELEALRATRLTEIAQMDEILAELHPLIKEMQDA